MSVLRRLSALLLGLLFLQLTLLGDGRSCRSHGSAGMGASMAGMPMASAPHDGCGAERAANGCATMPSCATVVAAPATVVAFVQHVSPTRAHSAPVSLHSQPAAGPDVPPPRG